MTETPDKVLIVDDDAEIRDLLGHYLRGQGFDVSLAADGREMWAQLKSGEPDIIVLDLMLGPHLPAIGGQADEIGRAHV